MMLLLFKNRQNQRERGPKVDVKNAGIPGFGVKIHRQQQWRTQSIDFKFSFPNLRRHRPIAFVICPPMRATSRFIKGVRVRIKPHKSQFTTQHPFKYRLQVRNVLDELHIWQHLKRRIPQPHCRNITSRDKIRTIRLTAGRFNQRVG